MPDAPGPSTGPSTGSSINTETRPECKKLASLISRLIGDEPLYNKDTVLFCHWTQNVVMATFLDTTQRFLHIPEGPPASPGTRSIHGWGSSCANVGKWLYLASKQVTSGKRIPKLRRMPSASCSIQSRPHGRRPRLQSTTSWAPRYSPP